MLSNKEDFDRFMADDDISAYVAILNANVRDANSQTETLRKSKENSKILNSSFRSGKSNVDNSKITYNDKNMEEFIQPKHQNWNRVKKKHGSNSLFTQNSCKNFVDHILRTDHKPGNRVDG